MNCLSLSYYFSFVQILVLFFSKIAKQKKMANIDHLDSVKLTEESNRHFMTSTSNRGIVEMDLFTVIGKNRDDDEVVPVTYRATCNIVCHILAIGYWVGLMLATFGDSFGGGPCLAMMLSMAFNLSTNSKWENAKGSENQRQEMINVKIRSPPCTLYIGQLDACASLIV